MLRILGSVSLRVHRGGALICGTFTSGAAYLFATLRDKHGCTAVSVRFRWQSGGRVGAILTHALRAISAWRRSPLPRSPVRLRRGSCRGRVTGSGIGARRLEMAQVDDHRVPIFLGPVRKVAPRHRGGGTTWPSGNTPLRSTRFTSSSVRRASPVSLSGVRLRLTKVPVRRLELDAAAGEILRVVRPLRAVGARGSRCSRWHHDVAAALGDGALAPDRRCRRRRRGRPPSASRTSRAAR